MACSRPESIVLAGELGIGSLNFAAGPEEQLREAVAAYRQAIAASPAPPRRITDAFCVTPAALVLPDDREACALGFQGARYHAEGLATYFFSPTRQVGPPELSTAPLTPAELERAMAARGAPGSALNTVIGDPAAALAAVERFASCGVDELILVMQMGGVPHEAVMRSLRTFAEEVMPRV
jgi:alkanesulfonate monooxygenase SsuD/methylene tetrahydromethanopterin reductase-like flavin-dependent oxidoreductase (luciferase family)